MEGNIGKRKKIRVKSWRLKLREEVCRWQGEGGRGAKVSAALSVPLWSPGLSASDLVTTNVCAACPFAVLVLPFPERLKGTEAHKVLRFSF